MLPTKVAVRGLPPPAPAVALDALVLKRRTGWVRPPTVRWPGGQPSRLVRDGLAEVDGTDADGGPERTLYRATDSGGRELADWLGQIAPPAPFVSNEIFAKVVVAILAEAAGAAGEGSDPAAFLRAQRAAHKERMRELTAVKTAPGADLATVLSADYALNHLDADLRWMTTTAGRLAALTKEITTE